MNKKIIGIATGAFALITLLIFLLWRFQVLTFPSFLNPVSKSYSVIRFNPKAPQKIEKSGILNGKGIPNSTVKISLTPSRITEDLSVDSKGEWIYKFPSSLKDGIQRLTVLTMDKTEQIADIKSYKLQFADSGFLKQFNFFGFASPKASFAQAIPDPKFLTNEWANQMQDLGIYTVIEDDEIILYSKEELKKSYPSYKIPCEEKPCLRRPEPIENILREALSQPNLISKLVLKLYDNGYAPYHALGDYFPEIEDLVKQNEVKIPPNYVPRFPITKEEIEETQLVQYIYEVIQENRSRNYYWTHPDAMAKLFIEKTDPIFGIHSIIKWATLKPNEVTYEERLNALLGLTVLAAPLEKLGLKALEITSNTALDITKLVKESGAIRKALKAGEHIPMEIVVSRAGGWLSKKTADLPAMLVTKPNLFNKYGINYRRLTQNPLANHEIDKRFFNTDGSPNEALLEIYERVRAAASEVLKDPEAQIYVVGGVADKFDKTGYISDLDFYIRSKNVPADVIRESIDTEAKNQAYEIGLKVNKGHIPEHPKDPQFVDIMISSYYPFEYSGLIMEVGDSVVFYDITQRAWYSAAIIGTPQPLLDISVVLRSPVWNKRGNLPPSSFGSARFAQRGGDVAVPVQIFSKNIFNQTVLPALKAKRAFPVSRSDVLQPAANNVKKAIIEFQKRTGKNLSPNINLLDDIVGNGKVFIVDDRFFSKDMGAGFRIGDMIVLGFKRYDDIRGIGSLHHEMTHLIGKYPKGFQYRGESEKDRVFTAIYELMTDAWADLAMNQRIMSAGSHIATGGYAAENRWILDQLFNKIFARNPRLLDDFLEFAINPNADEFMVKILKNKNAGFDQFMQFLRKTHGIDFRAIAYTAGALEATNKLQSEDALFSDPVIEFGPDFFTDEPKQETYLVSINKIQGAFTANAKLDVGALVSTLEGEAADPSGFSFRWLLDDAVLNKECTDGCELTLPSDLTGGKHILKLDLLKKGSEEVEASDSFSITVEKPPVSVSSISVNNGGPINPENFDDVISISLNGTAGQAEEFNIPVVVNFSDGSSKYTGLKFKYEPENENPPEPSGAPPSCKEPYPQCAQTTGLEDYPEGHTILVTPVCDSAGNITDYQKEDLGNRGECQ